jgi:hypothetical protein
MSRNRLVALTAVVLALLVPGATAQQRDRTAKPDEKRVGTALIAGRVTTSDTGDVPVRRAIATLTPADGTESTSAITDNEGRFVFAGLVDGRYTLNVKKAAHLSMNYGAKRPGRPGTTIVLAADQQLTGLRVTLSPGGVITGFVRMTNGDPLLDTQVVAIPAAQASAGGQYVGGQPFRTDDRGEFRIYGLAPGSYLVAALPVGGRNEIQQRSVAEYEELLRTLAQRPAIVAGQQPAATPAPPPSPPSLVGYAPMYFPGTAVSSNAAVVTVRAGEVRDGIDIPVAPVRVGSVSGFVRAADGSPTQNVQLSVTPMGPPLPLVGSLTVRTSRPEKDGRFTLANVAPGAYRITARAGGVVYSPDGSSVNINPENQTEWAVADVQMQGADVDGVLLQLQPGMTFSGRIVATGTAPQPASWKAASIRIQEPSPTGQMNVVMNGVSMGSTQSRTVNLQDDGSFQIKGIQPANYEIVLTLPPGLRSVWSVKSIIAGGRDVRDAPLMFDQTSLVDVSVNLTDQPTQVSGTLSSASGQAASDYYLVIFPAERTLWHERSPRLRILRPAADGGYSTRELLPGTYRIAALTDVEENEWRTAAFLESVFESSIAVTVVEGQAVRQDIRIR